MNYKKLFSAILCANFLINSTYTPVVFASEATYKQVVVNENYDPFADEETTKEPENLTMKQRVAKIMEEEKNKNKKQIIEGVENGHIYIPKDTIGIGYVYEVQKAGGFGRKGVLRIAGKEIKTLNNITVPLKKGLEGKGKTDGGAVAVAAAVSLVGGLFMKGTNIEYPAGTNFEVEVRNNVDLQTTPENLKEAMNPNIPHGIELNIEVK